MSTLSGSGIERRTINVYGLTGEFTVLKGSSGEPVTVKYFQTNASNRDSGASGNALDLLKELKPMRELVKTEDLKDLRSLLQRDLSDYRVATELVPYLQGHKSVVGFFPSILVALMPSGFMSQGEQQDYPKGESESDTPLIINYAECWSVENYKVDGSPVSLAKLSISPSSTDLIVLDGQHRANAFRYMAGTFDDAMDDTKIYSVFYNSCNSPSDGEFDAELPVTIVWFAGENQIQPNLISRKLFVDVNTSARKVSDSRSILLDDTDLASICVTEFYSYLSEIGFQMSHLSLFQSGFDCDGKFPSGFPKMSIFSPVTVNYMLSYFLLSRTNTVSRIGHNITRESFKYLDDNANFKSLCVGVTDQQLENVKDGDSDALADLDLSIRSHLTLRIYKLIDGFGFLKPHFEACEELDSEITGAGVAETIGTWQKIFKGGEGLYNAFHEIEEIDSAISLSARLRTYQNTVDTINSNFRDKRQSRADIDDYDKAFNTFISMAGITGYFMAIRKAIELVGWSDDLADSFLDEVNKYSVNEWTHILSTYKSSVIAENSPKLWPQNREIFLRFIQARSDDWVFFAEGSVESGHPDFLFTKNSVKRSLNSYTNDNGTEAPGEAKINEWLNSAIDGLTTCLAKINESPVSEALLREKLSTYINDEVESSYGP